MSSKIPPTAPPRFAWAVVILVVLGLFAEIVVDYLDGPQSSPSPYLLTALVTVAGLALGRKLPPGPWSGSGGK